MHCTALPAVPRWPAARLLHLQVSWDVISCAPYTEGTIKMLLKEGGR